MTDEYRVLQVIKDDDFLILKMIPNVYMTKRINKEQLNYRTLLDFYREYLGVLAKQVAKDFIEIKDEMKGVKR